MSLAGSWWIGGEVTLPICSPLYEGHAGLVRLEIRSGISLKLFFNQSCSCLVMVLFWGLYFIFELHGCILLNFSLHRIDSISHLLPSSVFFLISIHRNCLFNKCTNLKLTLLMVLSVWLLLSSFPLAESSPPDLLTRSSMVCCRQYSAMRKLLKLRSKIHQRVM